MDISCLASMFYKLFNRKFTSAASTCIKANIDGPWYWVAIKSKYTSNQKLFYELRRPNIRKLYSPFTDNVWYADLVINSLICN